MEKAIKIATQNGYYTTFFDKDTDVLLDPLFWQALGKGLGWKEYATWEEWDSDGKEHTVRELYWRFQWHRLITFLAEGKDINSFFEELIK